MQHIKVQISNALYPVRYHARRQYRKQREWLLWRLAKLVPRPVRYWVLIQAGAVATTGEYGDTVVPDLRFMEALERVEKQGYARP
jgi:hypothetical protein